MSKVGIYPGTFDPITYGHIDVIRKSLKIVDKLIIAVSEDYAKDYLFSAEERVLIIKDALFKDLKFNNKTIKVLTFNTLTTSFSLKHNATIIFRNKQLNNRIETVFLMSDPENQVISSKFVKEIAKLKGKVNNFVTKRTEKKIKEKYD